MGDDELILSDPSVELDPGLRCALELRTLLGTALNAYADILEDQAVDAAWAWLERLAAHLRRAAELHHLEQLGDGFLPDDAVELLAALESSLALIGSGAPEHAELALDVEEMTQRMVPIGAGGLWSDWGELLDLIWREREHVAGRPRTDRPDDWPTVPPPLKRRRRSDRAAVEALNDELNEQLRSGARLYNELTPDGRELTPRQRDAIRRQVIANAVVNRRIDLRTELFSRGDWPVVVLLLNELRTTSRSLVLAASPDPERRALAMGLNEARERAFVMNERIAGASWEDALRSLREFELDNLPR